MQTGLTRKEQLFVALSWLPKATVQAAFCAYPYDRYIRMHTLHHTCSVPTACAQPPRAFIHDPTAPLLHVHTRAPASQSVPRGCAARRIYSKPSEAWDSPEQEAQYKQWALDIMVTGGLAILMTAPAGLIIIQKLGPKWLEQDKSQGMEQSIQDLVSMWNVRTVHVHVSKLSGWRRAGSGERQRRASRIWG